MKRVIALSITLLVASSGVAVAQSPQTPPLADVARAEEARRKTARKATKVFTNSSLTPADASSVSAAPAATAKPPVENDPGGEIPDPPNISGGEGQPVDPASKKDQAYWAGRISKARVELSRTRMFADSLQTKINSLNTDWINRDNRVEKEKIKQELDTSLAELERLKKEIDLQTKAITAIEDEARRANVPAGWLRPSV